MPHGISRYRKGCRCETCRAANRAKWKRYWSCRRCGNPMPQPHGVTRCSRICGFCREEEARGS